MPNGRSIRDLFVRIGFDTDSAPLERVDRGVNSLKANLRTLRNVALLALGSGGLGGFFLKLSGEFEQAEVAFEVMLGSAERAQEVLADLYNFAKTTPFEIREIIGAGKQLLAFGFEAENLVDILTTLGNVAAGTVSPGQSLGENFRALARNLGQVRTQQRLLGRDALDFATRGVPIYEELAKVMGVQVNQVKSLQEQGAISFDFVEKAFQNMSAEGGRFFNLMERQSKTFLGIWSNIKDVVVLVAKDLGNTLLPQAKSVELQFLKFLEVNKKIIIQRGRKIFTEIGNGIMFALRMAKDFVSALIDMTEVVGGLENAIKIATASMLIMFSLSMLTSIGNIVTGLFKMATAFKAIGTAAAFAQIKAFAFPLLVASALAAVLLIVQDLVNFFDPEGKESLTGLILDAFENKFPNAFKSAKQVLEDFIDTLKEFFKTAKEGLLTPVNLLGEIPDYLKKRSPGAGGRTNLQTLEDFSETMIEGIKNFRLIPNTGEFQGGFVGTPPFARQGDTNINIGDINVTAPGANPDEIADAVKGVIENDILFPASRSLRPSEVQ
jgi:tape measure domain-containing protein